MNTDGGDSISILAHKITKSIHCEVPSILLELLNTVKSILNHLINMFLFINPTKYIHFLKHLSYRACPSGAHVT